MPQLDEEAEFMCLPDRGLDAANTQNPAKIRAAVKHLD